MDDIATIAGRDATAWAGDRPWHRKGTKLPGLMTPLNALIAASCDYTVVKLEVGIVDNTAPEHFGIQIPNTFSTGRLGPERQDESDPDSPLKFTPFEGSVKGRYTIVQNRDAFAFLEPALGKDIAYLETVGALGQGERVWAMAKLPDDFDIAPGDPVERYILITNTHDGSGSVKCIFTPIRVVCQNTLSAALKGAKHTVSIRHTKSAGKRMKELHKLLNANEKYWDKLKAAFTQLMLRDMTQFEVIEFIETMFPGKREEVRKADGSTIMIDTVPTRTQNMRDAVTNLFEGDAKGSKSVGRTHMGMFQAFTEWLDHHRSLNKTTNPWEATNFGSGVAKRQKAMDILTGRSKQTAVQANAEIQAAMASA